MNSTHVYLLRRLCVFVVAVAAMVLSFGKAFAQFTLTQTVPITINDNSTASPYPSAIVSSNLLGIITKVTVTLTGMNHGYPDDVDVLLVGPNGKKVMLMSDTGGGVDLRGTDITFDATATPSLSDEGAIVTGTYKPTDINEAQEIFSTVTAPYENSLADFVGENPNNTWQLYVKDDSFSDAGFITSWSLNLFTTPLIGLVTNIVRTVEDVPGTLTLTLQDSSTAAAVLTVTGTSPNLSFVNTNGFSSTGTGLERTLTITPVANAFGTNTLTVTVSDGLGTASTNFTFIVTPVNDGPSISLSTNRVFTTAGNVTTTSNIVTAVISDIDTDISALVLSSVSANPSVVADGAAVFTAGTGGTNTVVIAPNAGATGAAIVSLRVSDGAITNSADVEVVVNPVTYAVFGNGAPIRINDATNATPYPSIFSVANIPGNIARLSVVLADVNHSNPADLKALLVSPSGRSVVLMGGAGGANALSRTRITFDENAAATIPNGAAITTGAYKTADYIPGTTLPAPAPSTNISTTGLSGLNGSDPNGTWSLYVIDTANGSTGAITGGFLVNIFPAPTINGIETKYFTDEDTAFTVNFTVADFDGTVTNVTVSSGDASLFTGVVTRTGNNVALVVTPGSNRFGTNTLSVVATDNNGFIETKTFTVGVRPVNDTPTLSNISKQTTRAGIPLGPIGFTVGDVESDPGTLVVTFGSSNQKLIPTSNIVLTGAGANRSMTIYPAGVLAGNAELTVFVSDGSASSSKTLEIAVTDAPNPLFENPGLITFNENTTASPYPASINVSGLLGSVASIKVTLIGFNHTGPDDADILLQGPTGKKVILMSDAGGVNGVVNAQIVFDGASGNLLPDEAQIVSGTFAPSNYGGAEVFPQTTTNVVDSSLTTFVGTNPNGVWSLFVLDDETGNRGAQISGGWHLSIQTQPVLSSIPTQTTTEDTALRVGLLIGDSQPGVNYTITPTAGTPATLVKEFRLEGTGASRSLTIVPGGNLSGTNQINVSVSDGVTTSQTSFEFRVTPVDDLPAISGIADQRIAAGLPSAEIPFVVGDAETAAASITVVAVSGDTGLIPASGITLGGSGANRTIMLTPNGVRTGDTAITLTATDGTGQKFSRVFSVVVARNLSYANNTRINIRDRATGDPYPAAVTVPADVAGLVSSVSVTLLGFSHPYPDDVDVLLVSPEGRKVVLMSDAGGGVAASNLRMTFTSTGNLLPDEAALSSTTYQPADYEPGETLPAPAPTGAYSTSLDAFRGANPVGEWKLFVNDDTFPDGGSIEGGWFLILDVGPTLTTIGAQSTREDVPLVLPITINDSDTIASNVVMTATSSADSPANLLSSLRIEGLGATRNLIAAPSTNIFGTNLITLTLTDGRATNSATFGLTVTSVDDAPTVTTVTNLVNINEDGSTTVTFNYADIDSVVGNSNVVVVTSNQVLLPNHTNNIVLGGGAGTATLELTPLANQFGDTVVTFSITDRNSTTSTNVTLRVLPINDAPTFSVITNRTVIAGSPSEIIPFTVNDVETTSTDLSVRATSSNQALIPDSNIILDGTRVERSVQVTPIGVVGGTATINVIISDGALSVTNSFVVNVNPAPGSNFINTTPIVIRDNNTATPFPSTNVVSGVAGAVHRVFVTLDGLSHPVPDDIDMLLVGPAGQKVILMSDAGGRNPINNVRLRFDDLGQSLRDEGLIASGTNRPTDFEVSDAFPSGVPAGPYSDSLAVFKGTNPNGNWLLYVMDDSAPVAGRINNGWSITIESAPTIALTSSTLVTFNEDTTANSTFTIADPATTDLSTLQLSFSASNPTLMPAGSVTFSRSAGNITALLRPAAHEFGTNNLTLTVTRADGATSSTVVNMNVLPVNQPPTISRLTQKTTTEDLPLSFIFIVTDFDTVVTNLMLTATSGNPTLITSTNLLLLDSTNVLARMPSNEIRFTLRPNTDQIGNSLITITVTDKVDGGISPVISTFNFVVNGINDPPTITGVANIGTQAGAPSAAASFNIRDADSATVNLTATSSDQALIKNASIAVTRGIGGSLPGVQTNTVVVTPEAGVEGKATITLTITDGTTTNATAFDVTIRPSRDRVFGNSSELVINGNGPAATYPSTVEVSGLSGKIRKLVVNLNGFAHRFPDDVDMLLVGPRGEKMVLMSDAGGGSSVTNLNLKFDDQASTVVSDVSLASGTFRPFNYEGTSNDSFSSPAPAGPYGTNLVSFVGTSPNGTWSLYITDDTPSDAGTIKNGWSLAITTQPPIEGLADTTIEEDSTIRIPFTIGEESFVPAEFTLSAASSNSSLVVGTNITFAGSGTNWTATLTPVANAFGTNAITFIAASADGLTVSNKFALTVTPVNDTPFITSVADQVITAGSSLVIPFSYGDVETPKRDVGFSILVSNTELLPNGSVFVNGDNLVILPVGVHTGTSRISINVTDAQGLANSSTFTVTVFPSQNPVFANETGIKVADNAPGAPYPSTLTVSGISGTVSKVTVTLNRFNHAFPDDVDVMLVGPQGQKVMLMSDAGGGNRLVDARLTFDDSAAANVPDNGVISSGSYKPSNYETENMAAPAPAGPYSTALSAFNGVDPNGVWSLYVQDDTAPDGGTILAGWLLSVVTTTPTISAVADVVTDEDVPVVVNFQVADADTALTNLVVEARSSVDTLLTLNLTGTGGNRTLTITPIANQSGTETITLSVGDGTSFARSLFSVTVNPVNDAPTLSALSDKSTPANLNASVSFTVGDVDDAVTNLVTEVSSSNAALGVASISGDEAERVLTFIPAGTLGNTTISVTVNDGDATVTKTFVLSVLAPLEPKVGDLPDVTINEDGTLQFAISIQNASANLTVRASTDNKSLVSSIGLSGFGPNRNAVVNLVPDASGSAIIVVTARDDLGTRTEAFLLTVLPVNDPVSLDPIVDQTTTSDVAAIVTLGITDKDTDRANMVYSATFSNTNLVSGVQFVDNGTAMQAIVNLVTNQTGLSSVTLTVSDGGNSVSRSFALLVSAAPKAPSISEILDATIDANTSLTTGFTISGTPSFSLVVTGASENVDLVSSVVISGVGSTRSALVTLVPKRSGTATITVTAVNEFGTTTESFVLTVVPVVEPEPALLAASVVEGNFTIAVTGTPNAQLVIEGSSNLSTWTTVGNITLDAAGKGQFTVPVAAVDGARTYRARNP